MHFVSVSTVSSQNEDDVDGAGNEHKIVESSVDPEFLFEDADENMAMQALDGFLLVLSNDGDIIYVSENIHDYIGIQQASFDFFFIFCHKFSGPLFPNRCSRNSKFCIIPMMDIDSLTSENRLEFFELLLT